MSKRGQRLQCVGMLQIILSRRQKQPVVQIVRKNMKERLIGFDGFGVVCNRLSVRPFHQKALLLRQMIREVDGKLRLLAGFNFVA